MKRDMDLVREILASIEADPHTGLGFSVISGHPNANADEEAIAYHLTLLREAGLIEAIVLPQTEERAYQIYAQRLTWAGHDFMDTMRDPEVWDRTKASAAKIGGWSFGLLKDLGTAYLKHVAKERLGLDL